MNRKLIINADDNGRTWNIARGILDANHGGVVTSTTYMMYMPIAAACVRETSTSTPDLGMGVHLNLTLGRPLSEPSDVPDLVDGHGVDLRSHRSAW